jgi:outer membrane receptor protein involved in Fe transport
LAVDGPWEVSFSPGMGAPKKTSFLDLKSWSNNPDPAIKYFSGTATYRKTIQVPQNVLAGGLRLILDLGAVSNLAAVKVNGVDLGVGWYAPFRFDATAALKPGANTLEIAVVNTWANRLIGDEQEPEDIEWGKECSLSGRLAGRPLVAYPDWFVKGQPRPSQGRKTFANWNYYTKDSPLLPAGLLGPVVLRVMQATPL